MGARVLVIEDNPTNLALMDYLICAFGHTTVTASDGQQGLLAAARERPDIIICDIHLPVLDGYQVAQRLKNDFSLRHIPLLAVTALAMVGDRDKILAAGFDGHLVKPIDPETFVSRIESYLHGEAGSTE